jgi:hypothetical protein
MTNKPVTPTKPDPQDQLKLLAEAVLEAHRCMAPGHHQTVCIEEQGESCSFALCRKYTECLHHNKCRCPACTVAREVVGQGYNNELEGDYMNRGKVVEHVVSMPMLVKTQRKGGRYVAVMHGWTLPVGMTVEGDGVEDAIEKLEEQMRQYWVAFMKAL